MEEIWKDVIGYEGKYKISNFGNVFSLIRNKALKYNTRKGYNFIKLFDKNNNPKMICVHILVANAFLGNRSADHINHKDGNGTNNHISNLEYISVRENRNHKLLMDRGLVGIRKTKSGKFSSQIRINGKIKHLGTFDTEIEASNAYKSACEKIGEYKYSYKEQK